MEQDARSDRVDGRLQTRTRQRQQERKCPHCGQGFSKTEHLARHVRSHTKEKPFGCSLCDKTYGRHDSLLRHIRTHSPSKEASRKSQPNLIPSPSASESVNPPGSEASPSEQSIDPLLSSQRQHQIFSQDTTNIIDDSIHDFHTPTLVYSTGHPDAGPNSVSSAPPDSTPRPGTGALYPDDGVSLLGASTDPNLWPLGTSTHEPLWLLGDRFDINALNYSISATIPEWQHINSAADNNRGAYDAVDPIQDMIASAPFDFRIVVQEIWYTRVNHDLAHQGVSGRAFDQDQVDEVYRASLSSRLRPNIPDDSLPSADFLNLCIKLYFARFNQSLPLIHAASFRPSSENALLLLSICSMGALFVGSSTATVQGRRIYQRLNKAILASWETSVRRGGREALSMVQAATLGQTFGMLSGNPNDLFMTESFHGTIIAWARQVGIFSISDPLQTSDVVNATDTGDAWRSWIQAEETVRVAMALYIHDCELATIFHHEPLLRHSRSRLPRCCPEDVFAATTASQWHSIVKDLKSTESRQLMTDVIHASPNTASYSHMHAYGSLAGMIASIIEARGSSLDEALVQNFRNLLLSWHGDRSKVVREPREDPHCLATLWHEAFLLLYADFDLLERLVGRDGPLLTEETAERGRSWASSPEAQRCVLHALLIQRHMEVPQVGMGPAIHVPKALFYSGIAIYCYIKYRPQGQTETSLLEEGCCPEFQVSEPDYGFIRRTGRPRPVRFCSIDPSTLCNTVDLLRRVGHWDLARKFATILETLVNDLADPFPAMAP